MSTQERIQLSEMINLIPDQRVRILQIIRLGLVIGLVLFLGIVLFITFSGVPVSEMEIETQPDSFSSIENLLSIVNGAFAAISFLVYIFLKKKLFNPSALPDKIKDDIRIGYITNYGIEHYLNLYHKTMITTMGAIEGFAFFGLVTMMIIGTNLNIMEYPIYFLNLITPVITILIGIMGFPSKGKLVKDFEKYFVEKIV